MFVDNSNTCRKESVLLGNCCIYWMCNFSTCKYKFITISFCTLYNKSDCSYFSGFTACTCSCKNCILQCIYCKQKYTQVQKLIILKVSSTNEVVVNNILKKIIIVFTYLHCRLIKVFIQRQQQYIEPYKIYYYLITVYTSKDN